LPGIEAQYRRLILELNAREYWLGFSEFLANRTNRKKPPMKFREGELS
jgi:hypothetical protein